MSSLPSSVDVAIIGAGAAGLGAAHALKGSGLSTIVLEARNRIGGRVCRSFVDHGRNQVSFIIGDRMETFPVPFASRACVDTKPCGRNALQPRRVYGFDFAA